MMGRTLMKALLSLLAGVSLVSVVAHPAAGQTRPTQPQAYVVREYMKLDPLKSEQYRKLVQDIWVPYQKERVRSGLIRGWNLFSVRYPGGTGSEYNLVGVTFYAKFGDIDSGGKNEEVFNKVHPKLLYRETTRKMGECSQVVRREVLATMDSAAPGPQDPRSQPTAAPVKYQRCDYMKVAPEPGNAGQYLEAESKIYKPVHQEVINQGGMRAWSVNAVLFPSGADKEYNFTTVQAFDQLEQLDPLGSSRAKYQGIWAKVHPDMKQGDMNPNLLRRLVRSEVLQLLEFVR